MGSSAHATDGLDNLKSTSGPYPSPSGFTPPYSSHSPTPQAQFFPVAGETYLNYEAPVMYGGHPPTPHTPGTPNTPGASSNPGGYQQATQAGPRAAAGYAMTGQPQYPSPHAGYQTSAGMMPQATQAMATHQPIAPALAPRGAPVLRPTPNMSVGVMGQSPGLGDAEQPTHVVGGQGRRGILPSAPGRAPVGQDGKGPYQFEKTADGKFQCPHCPKTYLHQKHLKRHMLRHTGDRPYRCVLCHDTFSRSDILKRHFQKCSIRRGNPQGVSHLSHPGAHVKKGQPPAPQRTLPNAGMGEDLHQLNGTLGGLQVQGEGMSHSYPMVPNPEGGLPNLAGDQNQMSRSANGGNQAGAATRGGNMNQTYGANPQMQQYQMGGQNGMPTMYGAGDAGQPVDWAQHLGTQNLGGFQQHSGAQHTYGSAFSPNIGQTQIAVKDDNSAAESGRADGMPGVNASPDPYFFAIETPQTSREKLASRITSFLQNASNSMYPSDLDLASFFSPDNVIEFLTNYKHFHIHFPMLHLRTFQVADAYEGLVASLACVGACYAKERVQGDQVRRVAEVLWDSLSDQSPICQSITTQAQNFKDPYQWTAQDVEQIQSFVAVHMLLIWNGTADQRESARTRMSLLASFVRNSGLLSFNPQTPDSSEYNWESWVEQEKMVRLVHIVYLADTAMFLYFNMQPQLDPFDIEVPLPCDDGAWDAPTPIDCAAALGLYGQEECQQRNPDGTQASRQPQMNMALTALLAESQDRQPGPTNLWSKFILVHAIIALLLRVETGGYTLAEGSGFEDSDAKSRAVIVNALAKFKLNWDTDMANQFPAAAPANPRKYGFSRDGIYFYWLAMAMLKQSQKPYLTAAPDARFMKVMHWIKSLKQWVQAEGAKRGEELGSVGAIDKDYGLADTLDMTMLFQPFPQVMGDPRFPSVHTEEA